MVFQAAWVEADSGWDLLIFEPGSEEVVPVFFARAQALDGGVKLEHCLRHGLTGGVSIIAAVSLEAPVDQGAEPSWIGSGSHCGQTSILGMKCAATDGIDRRFAENHGLGLRGADGEEPQIFLRARRHPPPGTMGRSLKFSPDWMIVLIQQQKDGIGSGVGIDLTRGEQRFHQGRRQMSLVVQVALDTPKVLDLWSWKSERCFTEFRGLHASLRRKVMFQPFQRFHKSPVI